MSTSFFSIFFNNKNELDFDKQRMEDRGNQWLQSPINFTVPYENACEFGHELYPLITAPIGFALLSSGLLLASAISVVTSISSLIVAVGAAAFMNKELCDNALKVATYAALAAIGTLLAGVIFAIGGVFAAPYYFAKLSSRGISSLVSTINADEEFIYDEECNQYYTIN